LARKVFGNGEIMNEERTKKVFKITIFILLLIVLFSFIFDVGMGFYNKIRCKSRDMVERMVNYCEKKGLRLIDMRFEDGLCISVCGR